MPPPGYEPFLRAICENPADDTARLVYADWLDENGDPERAEFIRCQIEVAVCGASRTLSGPTLARHAALSRHIPAWQSELPRLPGINWPGFFRRGFPFGVDVSDGRWLVRHHEAVFSSAPVEELSVASAGLRTLTRVLELTELGRLSRLWLFQCRLAAGEWSVVADCPHLGRLSFLGVSCATQSWHSPGGLADPVLTRADAETLAGSPFLRRALELQLNGWIESETADVLKARFDKVNAGRRSPTPPPETPPP